MVDEGKPTRKSSRINLIPADNEVVVLTITRELLKRWEISYLIPDELLPMRLMDVFEAPILSSAKILILLHEEVLGQRGMVYVAAKAARRACTKTGWDHPDSLRALELCDQYAEGKEVSREELENAVQAADWAATEAEDEEAQDAAYMASLAASLAVVTDATENADTATWATETSSEKERRLQLVNCREWLMRGSPKERAPVLTRYQRIMRSL
jgi:hypothetical protein